MPAFLAKKQPFYLPGWVTPRRRMLLYAAVCRRVWEDIRPAPLRELVTAAERATDGQAADETGRPVSRPVRPRGKRWMKPAPGR